jgi:hypothetical protein
MALRARRAGKARVPVAFALMLAVAGCGGGGAKIEAKVRPLPSPAPARCTSFIAQRQRVSRASARSVCRSATRAHWYHWTITNRGGGFAYAYCSATAYDGHGRKLWTEPLSPLPFPRTVGLKPGASYSLTWFLPVRGSPLPGSVVRYVPICRTTNTPLS